MLGVEDRHLDADYWIERAPEPDHLFLTRDQVAAHRRRLLDLDPSMTDLAALPEVIPADRIRAWIEAVSVRPGKAMYDGEGREIPAGELDALDAELALAAIADRRPGWGLAVRRSALRAFPTAVPAFSTRTDRGIDRRQESAVFLGTPVVVVHESRSGDWLFVVTEDYAAWVQRDAVAIGDRDAVLAHLDRVPYVVATGADVRTGVVPSAGSPSRLSLEMGMRAPILEVPDTATVCGQAATAGRVVEVPTADGNGGLDFAQVLVPRREDLSPEYLPLTARILVGQAFKFLGERYGWGHDHGTRDCSGLVREVYRSAGVTLPRNTSAQRDSPALADGDLDQLEVGDLVFIDGHVMMVIGHEDGQPWVIHDAYAVSFLVDGTPTEVPTNGVVVTPLLQLAPGGRPIEVLGVKRLRA